MKNTHPKQQLILYLNLFIWWVLYTSDGLFYVLEYLLFDVSVYAICITFVCILFMYVDQLSF